MTFQPFFRKTARLEFDEAATWYEAQRNGLGREFVSEIDRAVQRACETPQHNALEQNARPIASARAEGCCSSG